MDNIKQHIWDLIKQATDEDGGLESICDSPVADYGCNLAYRLAKDSGKKPQQIAEEIAANIKYGGFIEKVEAVNGYVNFHLNYKNFTKHVLADIDVKKRKPLKEKIVLEHTSVNPSGPIHVGRLRNTIIGDSLRRILDYAGYDVKTHYYVNDVGKQIVIITLGLEEKIIEIGFEPEDLPEHINKIIKGDTKYGKKEDWIIYTYYVLANNKFEKDEEFQEKVQELIHSAENGDKHALDKIKDTAARCLKGQKETFNRLDVKFDIFDYESASLIDGSVHEVLKKLKKNKLWKSSEVGGGLDLSDFELERKTGFTVLERVDGTTVYLSRDLAYHQKKARLGPRLINVLGEDHKMQAQELKTILENMLNFKAKIEVVHFSFVSFEGAKLSTRKGQIASVDELLDEAIEKAKDEVKKRKIATSDVGETIGIGAVKFHIIKTSPNKQITFKWDDALSFEGETGPYIQYAHARSCRIIEKSGVNVANIKAGEVSFDLENIEEKALVKTLSEFDETVDDVVTKLRPDILANYLIRLTADYGRFYMKCPVLDSNKDVRNRRLLLVAKTKNTINVGLELLGIKSPDRM